MSVLYPYAPQSLALHRCIWHFITQIERPEDPWLSPGTCLQPPLGPSFTIEFSKFCLVFSVSCPPQTQVMLRPSITGDTTPSSSWARSWMPQVFFGSDSIWIDQRLASNVRRLCVCSCTCRSRSNSSTARTSLAVIKPASAYIRHYPNLVQQVRPGCFTKQTWRISLVIPHQYHRHRRLRRLLWVHHLTAPDPCVLLSSPA